MQLNYKAANSLAASPSDIPPALDSANLFLPSELAALVHFRLVRSLHVVLGQKIDCRLAELGELVPQGRCLCCGYPSAVDICFCCQAGWWPPYNSIFHCELQARLAWYSLEAKLLEQGILDVSEVVLQAAPGLKPIFVAESGLERGAHLEAAL